MAYVYRHIRLDKNIPFYIGIGSDENFYRATNKAHRNKIWKHIVAKTEYEVDIIFDNITWDEAKIKEIEFIKLYGRINLHTGYLANMTDGGDGTVGRFVPDEVREKYRQISTGRKKSNEEIEKIRKASTGKKMSDESKGKLRVINIGNKRGVGYNHTDEAKKKISEAGRGNQYGIGNKNMLGKKHSEESRLKMSKSQAGKKRSAETKEKMRLKRTGMPCSEQTKLKISIANSGKKISEEAKQKMRDRAKGILQLDANGIVIRKFKNRDEAYSALNISFHSIGRILQGKYKSVKGVYLKTDDGLSYNRFQFQRRVFNIKQAV